MLVGKGLETQNQEKSSGHGGEEEEEVIEARNFLKWSFARFACAQ